MNSKYPLTKALGLEIENPLHWDSPTADFDQDVVSAKDLEKVLREARVVHADPQRGTDTAWTHYKMEHDTHTARLLCVQPITKSKEDVQMEGYVAHTDLLCEVLNYLESYEKSAFDSCEELAVYIREKAGISKRPDTAESLLRECVDRIRPENSVWADFRNRALALLGTNKCT